MPNQPLHVLFFPRWYPSDNDPQNGIFIRLHAIAVTKQSVRVSIVYAEPKESISKLELHHQHVNGVEEYISYYPKSSTPVLSKLKNGSAYRAALKLAYQAAMTDNGKPDLIHAHVLLRNAVLAAKWAKELNVPLVFSDHWSGYIRGAFKAKSAIFKYLSKNVIVQAKAISVVSNELKKAMQNNGLNGKFHLIPNVINFSSTTPSPQQREGIDLLSVGDMVDSIKNFSGLIDTFQKITRTRDDITLHLVGGGYDLETLIAKAEKIGLLNTRIIFHGRQPQEYVLEQMPLADIYINNSRTETFGMTVAEAVVSGTPVITTKCGGPQSFFDQRMGIEIEVDDNSELENALNTMLVEYSQYDLKEAAEELKHKFSYETVGRQFVSMYQEVLDKA